MKYPGLLIGLALVAVVAFCAPQLTSDDLKPWKNYELYSWQESASREWTFSLLYGTDSNKTVKQVFDKKTALRGLHQLKRKLSTIPKGSYVAWVDQLNSNGVKVRGSESLSYPPDEVVCQVMQYAQALNIQIDGPPMSATELTSCRILP